MTSNALVLVTGVAGFVGMNVAVRLLRSGCRVVGVDDLNDYYAVQLKHDRLKHIARLYPDKQFEFHQISIEDERAMVNLALSFAPQSIVHLAAQPGVRFSIENPMAYARSNLMGMTSILQVARATEVQHMVYASSSSVYGGNRKVPYSETDRVDSPVSFYAATKRANEAMAASYSSMYKLPMTGLRFFTVYGPWGRPDMAPWLFTQAIMRGQAIKVFGYGKPQRDYTYIDDITDGVCRVLGVPPVETGQGLHRVLNIGNHQPVSVLQFIDTLERVIGKQAMREYVPMQPGDVDITFADIGAMKRLVGFEPKTSLEEGLGKFVDWFRHYQSQRIGNQVSLPKQVIQPD